MKRIAFIVLVLVLWLATWKGATSPRAPAPDLAQTSFPAMEATVLPTPGQNLVP